MLAQVLIQGQCNVDHVNRKQCTLLSYSVTYGDRSLSLTRLLLNVGAKVWPEDTRWLIDPVHRLNLERDCSAFTWLMKSLMREENDMTNFEQTLYLLGQCMGQEPIKMRTHVTGVMQHLGGQTSHKAMGALFVRVKSQLCVYWCQPQPLKYLCLKRIRQTIGPKNLSDENKLKSLDIPNPMLHYLQLGT